MFKVGFIYPGYENLGIEYLSSGLKREDFDTRLFLDPMLFSESGFINNKFLADIFSFRKYLLRDILSYGPDMLCFSVVTDNYVWACLWAKEIKKHLSVPVVFGGIHPTSAPESVIAEDGVDYICIGEGDIALVELAAAIRDRATTTSIQNIWAKKDGFVFKNQIRPTIACLDFLPFPDKDFYHSRFPIFSDGYLIATSRGCPFACAYCCNNVYRALYKNQAEMVRKRGVDNVLAELHQAKEKYRPKFVHFIDEVFNYNFPWMYRFLERYKKEIALPFSCYAYPDLIDVSVARALKEAHCFKVQMGVQIGDENKRRRILKRPSSQQKIAEAIDVLRKEKIYVTCDNIFGFPDEKEEDLLSLSYLYHEHMPNHCEVFWLRYYPQAEITTWALDNQYIQSEKKMKIEKGEFNVGLIRQPEHADIKSHARQFMILLNVFPLFSHALRSFILKKRIYRFFPIPPFVLLLIVVRMLNHPWRDFNAMRTIRRYLYFCVKKIYKRP